MASNAGWNKSIPSGLSPIAQGDDEIRSFKSFMQAWWEQEHYGTDGSASSAGVHKEGSARAFSQSAAPTAIAPKGQLWHDTDNDSLYVHNGTSWVTVSSNVVLGSQQTWTATQEFSNVVVTGSIGGVLSGTTRSDFSLANSEAKYLRIPVTGARRGDWCVASVQASYLTGGVTRLELWPQVHVNDVVDLTVLNQLGSNFSQSTTTVSVLVFRNPYTTL